jgi:CRISPR/Cas system Type II protein with McrA/HNH and RuvC-like nuclease domain
MLKHYGDSKYLKWYNSIIENAVTRNYKKGKTDLYLEIHHIVPKSLGGKTDWENIVTACFKCNGKKADMTPQEAGLTLLSKPKKPHWTPCIIIKFKKHHPQEWKNYLFWLEQTEEENN